MAEKTTTRRRPTTPSRRHSVTPILSNAGAPKRAAPLVSAERVQSYIRSRFNPIRSLTPELLSQYLDAYKTGYLRQCALIWDAIEERDYILSTVIPKRKAAAARHGWDILTLDSIDESQTTEAENHKKALQNFYNNLTVTNAIDENERGEVSLLLRQMMDAVGKRYAVHEIVWKPNQRSDVRGQMSVSEIENRQSQIENAQFGLSAELRFVPIWFFENTKGKLRYLQSEGAIEGVEMEDDAWLISVAQGIMPACSVAYMYKTMSLKDWVIYNERHGMPGIHGKTDAAKDSAEWEALVTAVQNFAADWAMVTNSGATIEKVDMAATGQLPYPPLVELMDRAMSALWRGADLSTISGKTSEGGQGASLQGAESQTLEEDDAKWLSETLSRNLDRRVIEYTFGEGVQPLAYIKIKTSQKKDIPNELLIDKFLVEVGAPVGVKNTLERYNRPLPDAGDDLLTPPSPAASVIPNQPGNPDPANPQSPPQADSPVAKKIENRKSAILQDSAPASPPGQPTDGDAARPGDKMRVSNAAPIPVGSLSEKFPSKEGWPTAGVGVSVPVSPVRRLADSPAVGRLLAETRMHLAEAQDQVLQPLRNRLEAIAQITEVSAQISAFEQLRKDLPELLKQMNINPETAKVLEFDISESILQGFQS